MNSATRDAYDLNGNLRFEKNAGGTVLREFAWDAEDRLLTIIDGTHTTEFEYDGLSRRVRIVETESGVEQSNNTFVWDGGQIVQRRNSAGTTVVRDYFSNGFTEGANDYFYTKDQLGSIREVVASNGTTIESRYDYTPWGEVTKIAGTGVESDFLYTGHYQHTESGLALTWYRAYDPAQGRWLSRDPLANMQPGALFDDERRLLSYNGYAEFLLEGPNLYAYVENNPVLYHDEDGRLKALIVGGVFGLSVAKHLIDTLADSAMQNKEVADIQAQREYAESCPFGSDWEERALRELERMENEYYGGIPDYAKTLSPGSSTNPGKPGKSGSLKK